MIPGLVHRLEEGRHAVPSFGKPRPHYPQAMRLSELNQVLAALGPMAAPESSADARHRISTRVAVCIAAQKQRAVGWDICEERMRFTHRRGTPVALRPRVAQRRPPVADQRRYGAARQPEFDGHVPS